MNVMPEIKKLHDVCSIEKTKHTNKKLPYIGLEDIESGTGKYLGSKEPRSMKSSTFSFSNQHLLYGRLRPYLNKVFLPDFEGHCSTEIFPILPVNGIDKKYLFYWFLMDSTVNKINLTCTGARMPRANLKEVMGFDILVSSLKEQKRIVTTIENAFEKIEHACTTAEKNLQNARELFESYFISLLKKGVIKNNKKNNSQMLFDELKKAKQKLIEKKKILDKKDLHIYPIEFPPLKVPKHWIWVYLSDVSLIQEGPGIRKHQYTDNGIQFLTVTNILDGEVDLENSKKYISLAQYEKYKHFTITKGDIVTACSGGSWGKSALFNSNERIILNTSTLRLRFYDDLCENKYLYYLTKTEYFKNCLSLHSTGQQPNYGYSHYSKIPIPLPPINEQKILVSNMEFMDVQIKALEAIYSRKLNSLLELKQSLLQKAFSGELTKNIDKLMDEAVA